MADSHILVTGANGFVGRALCARFLREGASVRAAVRSDSRGVNLPCSTVAIGDIGPDTDWGAALEKVTAIVHLAAHAYVAKERGANSIEECRRVNVAGTERLLRQAAKAGAHRIVYVSTIKVNGEQCDKPGFNETDPPRPEDAYGISKHEAEQALTCVCAETGIEAVILRPPLVYGPGAKGNLAALIRAIDRGIPLPLGCSDNQRSMIGMDNLVGAIRLCIDHPAAAGKTFVVDDGQPVSSAELARTIARALGRPSRLLPIPTPLLRLAGALTGKSAAISRLISSLVVDSRTIRNTLGWRPICSFEDGIRAMVRGYRDEKS